MSKIDEIIEQIEKQYQELSKDSERLDWIDEQIMCTINHTTIVNSCEKFNSIFVLYKKHSKTETADNIRDLIDKARKKGK